MAKEAESEKLKQLGDSLHQRLLAGDVTVPAEIAEAFMPRTITRLQHRFPQLNDPHLIEEAVTDALLNYFGRPEQYDPIKRSLTGYLYMSSRGDLLNLLDRRKREIQPMSLAEIVELDDADSEHGVEVQDDFDLEAWVQNQNSPVWQQLLHLLPDPVDQEIVVLMMDGVRETIIYADALGILDLTNEEQAAMVKQHKDRLKKRLQRHIRRSELNDHE